MCYIPIIVLGGWICWMVLGFTSVFSACICIMYVMWYMVAYGYVLC